MNWTAEPPTEPGLYWYSSDGQVSPVYIRFFEERLCAMDLTRGIEGPLDIKAPGMWWGPLESPEAARAEIDIKYGVKPCLFKEDAEFGATCPECTRPSEDDMISRPELETLARRVERLESRLADAAVAFDSNPL